MSTEKLWSLKNRWVTGSVGALLLFAALAAAIGFLWVPQAQARGAMMSLWESICSAAGAPGRYQGPALAAEQSGRPSDVIVTAQMMAPADSLSIGRGATLAMQCTMCHGARGMSPADSPHLAGQPAAATYKQLRDFKSGHRKSAIMEPLVSKLGDDDMRDLAAYYAYLPRERLRAPEQIDTSVPELVRNGSPIRNIGACASCHSAGVGKTASPWLDGLPERYLRDQLAAFVEGRRKNDLNGQMRNATRQMTTEEVNAVAKYYASR
jgi:cytochrome c553